MLLLSLVVPPAPPVPMRLLVLKADRRREPRAHLLLSYRIPSTKGRKPVPEERLAVPADSLWSDWIPANRSDRWAGIRRDAATGGATILMGMVLPLRIVARIEVGPLRDARWLYGQDALAITDDAGGRPRARVISGADGRLIAERDGGLAVIDRPGLPGLLWVRSNRPSAFVHSLWERSDFGAASEEIRRGGIWTEESRGGRSGRLDARAAAERYVDPDGRAEDLVGLFLGVRPLLGFRGRWLLRRAETLPPLQYEGVGRVRDRLSGSGGRVLTFTRRDLDDGREAHAVAPDGSLLVSGEAEMDVAVRPPTEFTGVPPPIGAARISGGGTRRFLIANPSEVGRYLVLWGSAGN